MYFINPQHRKNFQELCLRVSKTRYKDYRAAAYILSLPGLYQKTLSYFSDDGFNLDKALNQDFSSGFVILLNLAGDLFYSRTAGFSLTDAIGTLDDDNFRVMLQAITIRRYPEKPPDDEMIV